jgi:hypothetical protein
MYLVRDVFTAKPGMASKLARMMKDVMTSDPKMKARVLTDAISDYNMVVMETEVASLGEFEKNMKEYSERTDLKQKMAGYTDLWLTGRREVLRSVD